MTTVQEGMRKKKAPMLALLKGAAALTLVSGIVLAQTAPPTPPPAAPPGQAAPPPPSAPGDQPPAPPGGPAQQTAVQLSGSVVSYNYSPRGNYESLLIKSSDKLAQVNFPPDAGGTIAQAAHVGDNVHIAAMPEMGMPDHGVYELVSLTPANGQPITIAGPDAWRVQHVDGVVKNLNYGRRGEVNGAILDDGDFVHLRPDGATLLALAVGQKLSVDGYACPMLTGRNLIEADSVNGTLVRSAPPPPPGGPAERGPRERGPRADDGPPPPGPAGNPPPPPEPR